MKRKGLHLIISGILAVSLIGCGQSTGSGTETGSAVAKQTQEAQSTASAETGDQETQGASAKTDGEKVVLEWETSSVSERIPVLEEIIEEFTAQTGIEVELVSPGSDYETVMKTRMASGDLPDLWETHGWSIARYKEYLRPLNDQEWFGRVDESIMPVISDDDGSIYCLPLTVGINTMTYNKDVFENAGVDPYSLRTWDQFNEAMEKIKASGVTPIFCGNKDSQGIAQLCESIPPAFLTLQCVEDNQADALKDGSFDFSTYWRPIAELVDGWMQNGYFNEDILTSDNDQACQALANGECGIVFGGSNNLLFARTYNPDAQIGFLACPGAQEDDTTFLSMGEGMCIGMWKDTEYEEECLAFLEYLASPEVCSKIATVSGDNPGLSDVSSGDTYFTDAFRETQKAWEGNIEYVPLFDREYLPSGMWDDLGVGMTMLIMEPGNAIDESLSYLQDAYNEKIAQ